MLKPITASWHPNRCVMNIYIQWKMMPSIFMTFLFLFCSFIYHGFIWFIYIIIESVCFWRILKYRIRMRVLMRTFFHSWMSLCVTDCQIILYLFEFFAYSNMIHLSVLTQQQPHAHKYYLTKIASRNYTCCPNTSIT